MSTAFLEMPRDSKQTLQVVLVSDAPCGRVRAREASAVCVVEAQVFPMVVITLVEDAGLMV